MYRFNSSFVILLYLTIKVFEQIFNRFRAVLMLSLLELSILRISKWLPGDTNNPINLNVFSVFFLVMGYFISSITPFRYKKIFKILRVLLYIIWYNINLFKKQLLFDCTDLYPFAYIPFEWFIVNKTFSNLKLNININTH